MPCQVSKAQLGLQYVRISLDQCYACSHFAYMGNITRCQGSILYSCLWHLCNACFDKKCACEVGQCFSYLLAM